MADNIMLKEIKFALYSIKKNFQSSAELRTSFVANTIGMALNNVTFIILWIFFIQQVGVIGGWTAADVVALQAFIALAYGIVFSVAFGLRKLPEYVANGVFDRFMLSPKNVLLRTATSSLSPSAFGDIIFAIVCFIIFGFLVSISFYQILIILLLCVLVTITFFSAVVVIFSISFYFTDAHTVSSGMIDMFLSPALFHGGAFQGVMRFIFTFLIPSLVIGTLPVEAVKNMTLWKLSLVAILTLAWFLISMLVFKNAVKKYESANFMTFGG